MTEASESRRKRGCTVAAASVAVLTVIVLCGVCAVPYSAARFTNAFPIALTEVGPEWHVRGDLTQDAQAIAADVLRDCAPMGNGINVLFQHAWYNALTSGYDERLWLEGPDGSPDSFGLYMWSNNIFLRDETGQGGYKNQVLVCDRSQWTW